MTRKQTLATAILFALLFVPALSFAQPKPEAAGEKAAEEKATDETARIAKCTAWTMHYYQKPEPKRLPASMGCVAQTSKVDESSVMVPLLYFHAEASKSGKGVLEAYFAHFSGLSPKAQGVAVRLFWLSENPAAPKMLARAKTEWTAELPQSLIKWAEKKKRLAPLLKQKVRTATDLDTRWAAFFATGNAGYVRQIVGVWERTATNLGGEVLIRAAEWSLRANAQQHPLVAKTIRAMASERQEEQAKRLRALLP